LNPPASVCLLPISSGDDEDDDDIPASHYTEVLPYAVVW
jgi:hypothetical protein